MRKFLLYLFLLVIASSSFAQDTPLRGSRRGDAAGYASQNATALSMFGWGIVLAGGIATLCALLQESSSDSNGSSSH